MRLLVFREATCSLNVSLPAQLATEHCNVNCHCGFVILRVNDSESQVTWWPGKTKQSESSLLTEPNCRRSFTQDSSRWGLSNCLRYDKCCCCCRLVFNLNPPNHSPQYYHNHRDHNVWISHPTNSWTPDILTLHASCVSSVLVCSVLSGADDELRLAFLEISTFKRPNVAFFQKGKRKHAKMTTLGLARLGYLFPT